MCLFEEGSVQAAVVQGMQLSLAIIAHETFIRKRQVLV
jgi:hypothetical protein